MGLFSFLVCWFIFIYHKSSRTCFFESLIMLLIVVLVGYTLYLFLAL
jgi:hypothetical protein